jgi:alkyl hydroperoxide reductase subunit F
MYDLVIVGGGPAGLAAAMYAIRKNLNALLISPDLGGKVYRGLTIPGAESHRVLRPQGLVQEYVNQLSYLDHAYVAARAAELTYTDGHCRIETVAGDGDKAVYECKYVLIATGVTPRTLGVPGEREFAGRSLGYSSISYSHLLAEKRVFLIGDSRRTVTDARELALHAREVMLFFRSSGRYHDVHRRELTGIENVTMIDGDRILQFEGDKFAHTVVVADDDGVKHRYDADAFFVQLQPAPNSLIVKGIADVDDEDRIIVDMRNRTTAPRIFAAGDVTNVGFEQILVALGEGTKAALAIYESLSRE